MKTDLRGRIAWVVGATGTLGRQIARDLAVAGATVYISSRNERALNDLVAEAKRDPGVDLKPIPADITDRRSVDGAGSQIIRESGRLDILVNTASLSIFGDFLQLDDDSWDKVVQTKYLGYVRTIRAALPQMRKQRSGAIVNISGKGGRAPRDIHLPGSSVNAAINLLTKGLSNIYAKEGIRINAIAPGVIASSRLETIRSTSASVNKSDQAGAQRAMEGSNALGRLGTAKEVSDAVLFAVSDRASFTTGTVIEIDGG